MPSRMIRPSACTSPTLDQLSDFAERLFWRLLTNSDDAGRFEAHPDIIAGACFPLKTSRGISRQVAAAIASMTAAGLIHLYEHDGRTYGYFIKWAKHNRLRGKSKHPDPPEISPSSGELPQVAASCGELPLARAPLRTPTPSPSETSSFFCSRNRDGKGKNPRSTSFDESEVGDGPEKVGAFDSANGCPEIWKGLHDALRASKHLDRQPLYDWDWWERLVKLYESCEFSAVDAVISLDLWLEDHPKERESTIRSGRWKLRMRNGIEFMAEKERRREAIQRRTPR